MEEKLSLGHLAALFTVVNWGTTFIATKLLLEAFTPIEILLFRFVLGFLVLWLVCPRRLKVGDWHREAVFAAAGLTGVCLYYLLENIALTFSTASNVGGDRVRLAPVCCPLHPASQPGEGAAPLELPSGLCGVHGGDLPHQLQWQPALPGPQGGPAGGAGRRGVGGSTPCSPSGSAATAGT